MREVRYRYTGHSDNLIIQMDGNYPNISSGIVSFENTRTLSSISIRAADSPSGIYGIKSIVMDTGAS